MYLQKLKFLLLHYSALSYALALPEVLSQYSALVKEFFAFHQKKYQCLQQILLL